MSEHQRHTDFLRQCLHYTDISERLEREEKISGIQRDLRCVQHASWLMATLMLMVLAFFAYATILVANFTYNTSAFIINIFCAVGAAALISFLTFSILGIFYRRKLNQQREECRQVVARLLETHLGKPAPVLLQDSRDLPVGGENERTVRTAGKVTDSPIKFESAAQG